MGHPGEGKVSRALGIVLVALIPVACGGNGEDPVGPPSGNGNGDPVPGTVVGSVTHADAGVGGVTLTLRDGPGSDQEEVTPNGGSFEFSDVEAGSWELEVSPPDYFTLAGGESEVRSVEVTEGGTVTVNITLAPVEELELVEVDATSSLTFSPSTVDVSPGTRIQWTNDSNMLHTVTPEGHSEWAEGTIGSQGDTFEAVMNNPGEFEYICVPHVGDGMTGVVNVAP